MHRIQILFLLFVFMVFRESIGKQPVDCVNAGGLCIHNVLPCPPGSVANDTIRCCGGRRCCVVMSCSNEGMSCEATSGGRCVRDSPECTVNESPEPSIYHPFECCAEEFPFCCSPTQQIPLVI